MRSHPITPEHTNIPATNEEGQAVLPRLFTSTSNRKYKPINKHNCAGDHIIRDAKSSDLNPHRLLIISKRLDQQTECGFGDEEDSD